MTALGIFLMGMLGWILWGPEEFGRWLAKIRKSYDTEMRK